MYLSVPLITLYLIFIGHLLTLLCGFSGPFISPLIGSHEGSGARASDEIRVCVVFNFQPCKFHVLFAVCPAGTGAASRQGASRASHDELCRWEQRWAGLAPWGCGLGQWPCRPWEQGRALGHSRHQTAVPVPLSAVPCAVGTRGSGSSCP